VSTDASTDVNGAPPPSLLVSVSELARQRNRDKALISRQVGRLVADGKLQTYPGPRGAKLINVAEYDRAIGETADAFKEQAAETARLYRGDEITPNDSGLSLAGRQGVPAEGTVGAAQQKKLTYEAEIRRLDLLARLERVMPRDKVVEGVRKLLDVIIRQLEQLPLLDDELIAAARDGRQAVRAVLKKKVFDIRTAAAAAAAELQAQGKAEAADGGLEVEFDADMVEP
jgi:DNA-binding MarR family transcriptional regulator